MNGDTDVRVVVVGQTPPPWGGQAAMIAAMIEGHYSMVDLRHVRMAFSKDMANIGRPSAAKLWHILVVIWRIFRARLGGGTLLYYPPSGPNLVPICRDLVLLSLTRWLFPRTVFHFHAAGLSEVYASARRPVRALLDLAYAKPDGAIVLSTASPPDGAAVRARRTFVIPNGIPDVDRPRSIQNQNADHSRPPRILFVGVLKESKGIGVLIDACALLHRQGLRFSVDIVGQFESPSFDHDLRSRVAGHGLSRQVTFHGVQVNDSKTELFRQADIFCFPTYFEAENLSVVVLEAMRHGLPVVATAWRGLVDVVEDGVTGYLVPVRDVRATADRLAALLADPELAGALGAAGRRMYEREYTIDIFRQRIEDALVEVATQPRTGRRRWTAARRTKP